MKTLLSISSTYLNYTSIGKTKKEERKKEEEV